MSWAASGGLLEQPTFEEDAMAAGLQFSISISLDGFIAGPNQSEKDPIGEGGMQLHSWIFKLAAWRKSHGQGGGEVNDSNTVIEESMENIGATVMGRNMFGGGGGPWGDDPWNGWWGDDPPFHTPVFVLTHHARDPLVMAGGTTFTFVTDGIESALEQAKEAAGGKKVALGGGADVAQQYLAAGLIDEMQNQPGTDHARRGNPSVRQPCGGRPKAQADPHGRDARGHPSQVSRCEMRSARS